MGVSVWVGVGVRGGVEVSVWGGDLCVGVSVSVGVGRMGMSSGLVWGCLWGGGVCVGRGWVGARLSRSLHHTPQPSSNPRGKAHLAPVSASQSALIWLIMAG